MGTEPALNAALPIGYRSDQERIRIACSHLHGLILVGDHYGTVATAVRGDRPEKEQERRDSYCDRANLFFENQYVLTSKLRAKGPWSSYSRPHPSYSEQDYHMGVSDLPPGEVTEFVRDLLGASSDYRAGSALTGLDNTVYAINRLLN